MFNSHGTNARSYHYTLPLPRSAVPFESLWDCRTNINIFQSTADSTLPPCDKDSVLPVLCPVLRLLGGHLLLNPSPRRELVNPEEEQHIFGEWWKRWWSWMKPAGMFHEQSMQKFKQGHTCRTTFCGRTVYYLLYGRRYWPFRSPRIQHCASRRRNAAGRKFLPDTDI